MKNRSYLLVFVILCLPFFASGQLVPNGNFEEVNEWGMPENWGSNILFAGFVDSSGVIHGDTILNRFNLWKSTTDAHSGSYAMEVQNAYNVSLQKVIGSFILVSSDSNFSSYQSLLPLTSAPEHFSFYYKYFPVGGDSAEISARVFNSGSEQIGQVILKVGDTVDSYTPFSLPITYSSTEDVANMSITIRMSTDHVLPHYGTRFLIDDVSMSPLTLVENRPYDSEFVFPNPSLSGKCRITLSASDTEISVTDIMGRKAEAVIESQDAQSHELRLSHAASGLYFLRIKDGHASRIVKWLVSGKGE